MAVKVIPLHRNSACLDVATLKSREWRFVTVWRLEKESVNLVASVGPGFPGKGFVALKL